MVNEVYLLLLQGTGDSRRPEPEPAELKKRMASEEMARLEQKHQTSHTTATRTTAFSGISPDHLKDLLLKHGIGGKRGALVGLYRQELRDEEENRVLEVKDVFYNTEHHRYSVRYQYVDEMIVGETALEDMDWVHVYDLFEFATLIKTVDQSDAQLSGSSSTAFKILLGTRNFWPPWDSKMLGKRRRRKRQKLWQKCQTRQ